MHFTKMEGIGNDYIYINGFENEIPDPEALSRRISDRHFGIGSDGLIIIRPSECADFMMDMYNADGSRGRMCGNGIRCVGKYVFDNGLTDKTTLRIETLSGIKILYLMPGEDGKIREVRVDMGEPVLEAEKIPVNLERLGERRGAGAISAEELRENCDAGPISVEEMLENCDAGAFSAVRFREIPARTCPDAENPVISTPCIIGGAERVITCVSMGNPHCVVFTEEDVEMLDLPLIGPHFENDPLFPERVNTEFVNILSPGELKMRVWERGSGETYACGTGACAVLVAAVLNGYSGRSARIKLRGGELLISWDESDGHVYMTGPATKVFEGDIDA